MTLEWKESYRIGHDEVDQQHKHVFALAREFEIAFGKPSQRLAAMRLYQHVREHFTEEEALMRKIKYPCYAEHVESHNNILTKLNVVSQKIANDDGASKAIKEMLMDWMLNHVAIADVELAHFIQSQ